VAAEQRFPLGFGSSQDHACTANAGGQAGSCGKLLWRKGTDEVSKELCEVCQEGALQAQASLRLHLAAESIAPHLLLGRTNSKYVPSRQCSKEDSVKVSP
jgi:hypothetical protein